MIFASAAVSDFFIPLKDMSEHKIQSAEGPLQLTLQQVPKMLRPLCFSWAPQAFVISFKVLINRFS